MSWATTKGFNFRNTAAFTTDGANETYVIESDTYPTTRSIGGENVTFGIEAQEAGNSRNRSASAPNAPRLSGVHQIASTDGTAEEVFRVDLPATATYSIRLAAGDQGSGNVAFWEIRDTTSVVLSQASSATAADQYYDAGGTLRTTAALWLANNVAVEQAFSTTIFRIAIKRPASSSSVLAHLQIEQIIPPSCAITGTAIASITEDDIVAGGKTIIATLTGAAFIESGTADLGFAHGAVQWLAADAATHTYTISGLAFAPKGIRFYWSGIASASSTNSQALNERSGVGFAVSTSSRRAIGGFSQDTADPSNCGTAARNDCIACTTDGAGASDGRLDITAFNSDGFVLTVDDAAPADITVFWEAWGGSEITVAVIGDIAEPGATGDQTYTATGFVAGATDQVVMFAGCQSTAALNTDFAEASSMHIGFATSAADQVTVMGSADDASATMDTDGHCFTGQCISMIIAAGAATVNARASLTAFTTDGFTLNWAARATSNRRTVFMALKGGRWKAGSYTIAGNSGGATATVSGLPFTPIGISLLGRMTAEQTATATTAQNRIGLGTGTSTSSRRSMGRLSEDATGASEVDLAIDYEAVLCFPSTSGTLQAAYDINAMNSDGFQIIVDTAGGVASEWQGYLTFGQGFYFADAIPDFIAGLDSAQSETHGWDADVKAALDAGDFSRDSATEVTITLPAVATYDITAQETITVTVPDSILA